MSKPFLYDLILLRGLLTGKYFSVNLPNNEKTLDLFKKLNKKKLKLRLTQWLKEIKTIKKTYDKHIEIVIFPVYWVYDLSKKEMIFVNTQLQRFICDIKHENIFDKIIVGKTNSDKIEYTEDKRHFATGYLNYKKFMGNCK